jgi:hypothetical protein
MKPASPTALKSTQIWALAPFRPRFNASIPQAPAHVPEKFKKIWTEIPACCRNFYLKTGGCCAGLAEPNAAKMKTDLAPSQKTKTCSGDTCQITKPSKSEAEKTHQRHGRFKVLTTMKQWFKDFFHGFWEDFKLLFKGPEQKTGS